MSEAMEGLRLGNPPASSGMSGREKQEADSTPVADVGADHVDGEHSESVAHPRLFRLEDEWGSRGVLRRRLRCWLFFFPIKPFITPKSLFPISNPGQGRHLFFVLENSCHCVSIRGK